MNKNSSKEILLSIIGITILVVTVVGISFSFFNYAKLGTKVNKVNIAKMTFLYKENENGILLKDALPITDLEGMVDTNYFDFTVTADAEDAPITYDIVVTKTDDSTLDDTTIKLYLTQIEDGKEISIVDPIKFSKLTNYNNSDSALSGKLLINIPRVDINKYNGDYRLRLWISDDVIMYEENNGVIENNLTNKIFSVKVNVFAKNIDK